MAQRTSLLTLVVLIAAALILSGCQPQQTEEVGALPTLAQFPTLMPSDTASPTSTPSPTPSPTDTPSPTATDTPTVTPTFTPSITVTTSITPTFTLTPTLTATSTPTATDTPPATATPNAPQILTFTASVDSTSANTPVLLRWTTAADTARIDQLNQQGAVTQTFPVVPNGELTVTIPGNQGRVVVYRLVALRGGQEVTRSLPITIRCPIDWFFGNEFAPAGSACPTGVGANGPGAFQPFERGVMIFVNANGLNRIYGLQNDGSRYAALVNGWNGTDLPYDAAPSGLVQPQRMFRWAFVNTLAPVSTWQAQIGWGTTAIDENQRTIQFEEGGAFYVDAPTGVYRFSGGDLGTWTKIK